MAKEIRLRKGYLKKKGYIGFSWTTLFFGFIIPLVRGDWKWSAIMFGLGFVSGGFSNIIFAFMYNEIHVREILEKEEFIPESNLDEELLKKYEIYS